MMKIRIATICLLCVPMVTGVVLAGDETNRFHGASYDGYAQNTFYKQVTVANARFKGASYDGYARNTFLQVGVIDSDLLNARFTGGSYDGYALDSALDLSLATSAATLYLLR